MCKIPEGKATLLTLKAGGIHEHRKKNSHSYSPKLLKRKKRDDSPIAESLKRRKSFRGKNTQKILH